jgi:hypothetical protein
MIGLTQIEEQIVADKKLTFILMSWGRGTLVSHLLLANKT